MEAPVEKTAKPSETTYHSIQAGDTVYALAKRYGLTVEKLCELNNFQDNTILKVGSKIRCS
jgi:LysM repeat protein